MSVIAADCWMLRACAEAPPRLVTLAVSETLNFKPYLL